MYRPHTHCRACGYASPGAQGIKSDPKERLIEVFDLGIQPLANDFCKEDQSRAGYAPLKVLFCPRCTLAQLSVVVSPDILYRNYPYVTSPSKTMQGHFAKIAGDIEKIVGKDKSVLEIGSNDGKFLALMRDRGHNVQGIDPAENLAAIANAAGLPTIVGLFGRGTIQNLPQPCYDIIIARHVFCHADNWREFVSGLEVISHKESLICIEVPYAGDMLADCSFDTVYHEHLSYLSIKSVLALLNGTRLRLDRVERYQIHGGAIMLMLRWKQAGINYPENDFGENITVDDWHQFATTATHQIAELKRTIYSLVAKGKRVAGLGASAKSTVWISACGFTRKEIAFIADNTPQKQWRFSPGADIPILDEGAILRELPDYVVMWAWNYKSEILQKFDFARSRGVKFIVPVPSIEIV
jgi:SAM-dependent methyltransferase